jgi:hypothetical protein
MHLNARFWKNFPVIGCFVASPVAFTGRADDPAFAPALVEIEEALVPALLLRNWMMAPMPYWFLPFQHRWPERFTSCHVSASIRSMRRSTKAISVFSKWGAGASDFVRAMRETTSQITKTAL